jgi:predicted protein tyrosine phosphatase
MGELGVQVFAEQELLDRIGKGEKFYSHCISIRNPHEEMPNISSAFKEVLELKFYDITKKDRLPPAEYPLPSQEDVERIIQFVRDTRNSATGYTIHCLHGHSRSTATALGILYMFLGNEVDASRHLRKIHPDTKLTPNLCLLEHFDHFLGSRLVPIGEWMQLAYHEEARKMRPSTVEDRAVGPLDDFVQRGPPSRS